MSQETISRSDSTNIDRLYAITQRSVPLALLVVVALAILSAIMPTTKPMTVEHLIGQFRGDTYYWDMYGEPVDIRDRLLIRHSQINGKIAAAQLLGEMGPEATEAVPVLIEALKSGPNDIDTGDGVLPYRSTIAIALGKIGDARAIRPLTEKLKMQEKAVLGPGYSGTFAYEPTGVGHHAIVKALGMFGADAHSAVPFIRALEETDDHRLRDAIKKSLEQIGNDGLSDAF